MTKHCKHEFILKYILFSLTFDLNSISCVCVFSSGPTVVVDVKEDDALMAEEIFGPILPILTFESLKESIELTNRQDKPLALYIFSDESSVRTKHYENSWLAAANTQTDLVFCLLRW